MGNKRGVNLTGCREIKLRDSGLRIIYKITNDKIDILQIVYILIETLKAENNCDEELLKILKANHIDEDLHTAWFADRVNELQPEKEL